MTQKQLRSLSRKGTGAVCRELPLFRKKRDTFCTAERCVESLNNYPFSLYICRMLSSSNGDDDIIPSCRQRIPAFSFALGKAAKSAENAVISTLLMHQSYGLQHLRHKRFVFAFTSESGYTLGSSQRIAHIGSHGETGAFPPSATAQSCATSEITLNAVSVIPDSATLLYTYISRFSVPPLSATALFKSCFRYCQSC